MEAPRWHRFSDYYFNCVRSVDGQISGLLRELDQLDLTRNTIVVFTSDHGEMGGAHGLRGKGPFAYEEAIHLPLHVVHPDVRGGQDCQSLTGHIDLVPSLLAMAGVEPGKSGGTRRARVARQGHRPSARQPQGRHLAFGTRRRAFYVQRACNERQRDHAHRFRGEGIRAGSQGGPQALGYRPDLKKRGSLRTAFDGRYKFTRYFSPLDRNQPKDIDDLYRWNDVELFDLGSDPAEMTNLAAKKGANGELVMTMSAKLAALIKAEIGVDDGREMPPFEGIDWTIDRIDL